jgi:AraC-like DNA-binding protein
MIRDGAKTQGWFRGLADAKIGEALSLVHEDPAKAWSVAALASHVDISPSRFAARFREATGQSVISYVSQWRMHVATNLMQDGAYTLSEIAEKVGYESFPAFSRAFKKIVGIAPSSWQRT